MALFPSTAAEIQVQDNRVIGFIDYSLAESFTLPVSYKWLTRTANHKRGKVVWSWSAARSTEVHLGLSPQYAEAASTRHHARDVVIERISFVAQYRTVRKSMWSFAERFRLSSSYFALAYDPDAHVSQPPRSHRSSLPSTPPAKKSNRWSARAMPGRPSRLLGT